MIKTGYAPSGKNDNVIRLLFIGFVILLPFNFYEWNIFHVDRFEIKYTMVIFSLLFIAWLNNCFEFPRKKTAKEKLFYTFAFIYGASQFFSFINSPYPVNTVEQAIIMTYLLILMVVISETVLDEKMTGSIVNTMGIVSLIIGIGAVINYYLFAKSFTNPVHRLGQSGTTALGIISMGGDSVYFGDILLYSIGAVFFVISKLSRKKYWGWLSCPLLMLWFSAIALTYTKALYGAVICFFICLILLMKGKRSFVIMGVSMCIIAVVLNIKGPEYYHSIKSDIEDRPFAEAQKSAPAPPPLEKSVQAKPHAAERREAQVDNAKLQQKIAEDAKEETYIRERKINLARLNILSPLGSNSASIRIKGFFVGLENCAKHFWFGSGAGTSPLLLSDMANQFDNNAAEDTKELMRRKFVYGYHANMSLVDFHNLFFVEFFQVGIMGLIFLVCFVVFVIREQFRSIRVSPGRGDNINELLFATLIAMLFYRMTETLLVIPFLWFMLGLCLGVSKLYGKSDETPYFAENISGGSDVQQSC